MADRWMDDRDREPRDWRRTERSGRDGLRRYSEPPSFEADDYEGDGGYEGGRDAVFGTREGGPAYGGYRGARPGWQRPDYGGVSPAMRRGAYGRGQYGRSDDGGRYYGDDGREAVYREEYGLTDFGYRDPAYRSTRPDYGAYGYGEPGFNYGYDPQMLREMRRPASERGYGDGGRGERTERTERFERAGRNAGDFLHRAGERVANWFAGGSEARAYDPDFDRGRPEDRGARGLGPKGYKRADERISDEAHERLTEDPWLDAREIAVAVSAGEVTLSGTVTSREAKHRAERIVEYVGGVTHVQNNLRIERGDERTGYGDMAAGAQARRDEPSAMSNPGNGGDPSTTARKN